MAAAVRLFSQQGYARTTTKEIAAEAGISEGTIYTYFGSKQDLLFAFIEATAVDTLKPLLGEEGASREEVLRALLQDRLALAGRVGPLMKVVIGEALFDPELARAVAEKVAGPMLGLMEDFVARGSREGEFRQVSPQVVAEAVGGDLPELRHRLAHAVPGVDDGPGDLGVGGGDRRVTALWPDGAAGAAAHEEGDDAMRWTLLVLLALAASTVSAGAQSGPPQPLTLEAAVEFALAHHPALQQAEGRVATAQGTMARARAQERPQLDLSSRYTYLNTVPSFAASPGEPPVELGSQRTWLTNLVAQQMLLSGGRLEAVVRQTASAERAAEANRLRARQQVAYGAESAYLMLAASEQAVVVAQETLRAAEENDRVVEARFAERAAAQFEVLRGAGAGGGVAAGADQRGERRDGGAGDAGERAGAAGGHLHPGHDGVAGGDGAGGRALPCNGAGDAAGVGGGGVADEGGGGGRAVRAGAAPTDGQFPDRLPVRQPGDADAVLGALGGDGAADAALRLGADPGGDPGGDRDARPSGGGAGAAAQHGGAGGDDGAGAVAVGGHAGGRGGAPRGAGGGGAANLQRALPGGGGDADGDHGRAGGAGAGAAGPDPGADGTGAGGGRAAAGDGDDTSPAIHRSRHREEATTRHHPVCCW